MRIGMRASGAQLLCRHQRQKRAAGPTVPQFPRCEDRETVARAPCWEVGFGEDPGESGTVKTADVQPRPSPSALGRSDFSLVLLGLNTLHGSMAERPHSAGCGGGPLRLGAPCSPSGPGSSPSSTSCIRTLRPSRAAPTRSPLPVLLLRPWGLLPGAGPEPEVAPPAAPAGGSTEIRHSCAHSPKFPAHPSAGITWRIPRKPMSGLKASSVDKGTSAQRARPPGGTFCRVSGGDLRVSTTSTE